jgi:hypothetical protein
MANTLKTLSDGDITRKALSILHNKLVFCKTINRQYDDRFAREGAKNGGSLLIREPNQFTVRSGAVMDVQDVTESTQTLTVATQKGVDVNFSSVELTLSLDDFADRILEPAMSRLAAEVDKTVLHDVYTDVYNHVNTTFGTAPDLQDVQSARAKLSKGLAPPGNRIMLMESLGMNNVVHAGRALFNPSSEIARQYDMGVVGQAHGFTFYESELIPTHTQGTYADSDAGIVNTSTGITSGTATIAITSCTSGGTMTAGQVFTVADVYAVNPETKDRYAHLQQFVVTTAATASTTNITPAVSPTPITSGAKQNVELVSAGASKAVLTETAGGSGTLSTGYPQHMAYHRDAFTLVTADLELPRGADMAAREVYDGISLRLWRDGDITNDKFPCRIDVLFGWKCIRPEWACRLSG